MTVTSPIIKNAEAILDFSIPSELIISKYQEIGVEVSRFFNEVPRVDVFRCTKTGYRFYHPFSIFGDAQFYAELGKDMADYYVAGRWEHQKALTLINSDSKVLEVGCGSGFFLEQLHMKGAIAEGLELNPNALATVKAKGLKASGTMLHEFAQNHMGEFDVVCSFQVLEHIWDVRGYIEDALWALKPGGKLIIGVPNNNPFIFRHDVYHTLNLPPHHSGLWNRDVFEKLPQFFAMKTIEIFIEPLQEVSTWYRVQKEHYKTDSSFKGMMYKFLPRPVMKGIISMFRNKIEGRNVVAVFQKNSG